MRCEYIAEFNHKFTVPAAQKGSAFVRLRRKDLDWIFSLLHERTVNQDNTISVENRIFQLERTRWRNPLAGQTVIRPRTLGRARVDPLRAACDCTIRQ